MEDVFIVGGGPAGLAAAIALRLRGFDVTVADSRYRGMDKTCGEGILPQGVSAASLLGIGFAEAQSFAVRGIRLFGEGAAMESAFPNGCGYGMRRTALHTLLAERAEECGVKLRWGQPVNGIDDVKARWIIGADGTASRVRKWAGLEAFSRDSRRFGFTRHHRMEPWTDHIEGYYGDGLQVFVTPLGRKEIGVAVLSRKAEVRIAEALERFPEVRKRIGSAEIMSPERGAVTASKTLKHVVRGRVALIGDAAGSVDAITAEGLSCCFLHAIALADSLGRGDLPAYDQAHRKISGRPRFMAQFMLSMDRSGFVRRRAMRAMSARPALFEQLLAMHVGEARVSDFARTCAALGWRMAVVQES